MSFAVIEDVTVSPLTLPSAIAVLPIFVLLVVPVSLSPSTLKAKVRSTVPFGVSNLAFQVPVISAANPVRAKVASNASKATKALI
jgi:hypothetical protein